MNNFAMDCSKTIIILYNIAQGPNQFMKNRLVHCDLHSGNVLILVYSSETAISDFGLCKTLDNIFVKQDGKYGAPELFQDQRYSRKSDINALGIIMWELSSVN
jgi:serine/threonine protein kinase